MSAGGVPSGDAMQVDSAGLPDEITAKIDQTHKQCVASKHGGYAERRTDNFQAVYYEEEAPCARWLGDG